MFELNHLLSKLFRSSPRPAPRPATRLGLETLEERWVPAGVTYSGGPLIANAAVETVYYGSQWNTSAMSATRSGLDGFFGYITNSPYLDQLREYSVPGYTVGRGSFTGEAVLGPTQALANGSTVTDAQVEQALKDNFGKSLPQPSANQIYFVYTPPNVKDPAVQIGALGYHGSFMASNGHLAFYAIVSTLDAVKGNGQLAPLDQLTETSSHELAEAITDATGWGWISPVNATAGEIGDQCAGQDGFLGGYKVQKEWSNLAYNQSGNGALLLQADNLKSWAFTQNGNYYELGLDGNLWWRDLGYQWHYFDKGVTSIGVTGNRLWDLRTDHSLNYNDGYGWHNADNNVADFQVTGSDTWDIWDHHTDGSIYYNDGGAFVPLYPPPHQTFTLPTGHP